MMQHLSHRLPARSHVITLLLACVFPIHAWSPLVYFREAPAYLRRMEIGEMLGILAYVQAFLLLEGIRVLGLLTAIAFLLPGRLFKDYYVAQGSWVFGRFLFFRRCLSCRCRLGAVRFPRRAWRSLPDAWWFCRRCRSFWE